ncbi:uncharacterized protein LOC143881283 [Tasmannia lanceolata]|uniref:uncharacterized protein LOC143881283 n=1 Tax=Tasmannia lanceolata TaxID=3420 RepID=UPI004062B4D1
MRRNLKENEIDSFSSLLDSLNSIYLSAYVKDAWIWIPNSEGVFSVKSFFEKLDEDTSHHNRWWNCWRSYIPPRVAAFAWVVSHRCINTCDILQAKNVHLASWCILCQKNVETMDHVLLLCPFSSSVWMDIMRFCGMSWATLNSISETLKSWGGAFKGCIGESLWYSIPYAVIWFIWLERNNRIFNGKSRAAPHISLTIKIAIIQWAKCKGVLPYSVDQTLQKPQIVFRPIGLCDANEAEAKSLLFGRRWYKSHNMGPLMVEGDSTNVIAWDGGRRAGPWRLASTVEEIRDLVRDIRPSLTHRRRTTNSMADVLAKAGAIRSDTEISFNDITGIT